MDALRSYLTPQRNKKMRLAALEEGEDEDAFSEAGSAQEQEEMEEVMDEEREQPPWWAKKQFKMMTEIKDMMGSFSALKKDVNEIKNELTHVKLQASLAQESAEEARDIANNVEDRVKTLEADVVLHADIKKMIDEAIAGLQAITTETVGNLRSTTCPQPGGTNQSDNDNKMSRTAVVGGFDQDTPKEEVVTFLQQNLLKDAVGVEEAYGYTFGSVGFIRFNSRDAMFQFLKNVNAKPKPQIKDRDVWISTSKSPEERTKAKNLSKFKKVLLDTGLAEPDRVKVDYKRGLVFVNKHRAAEWKDDRLVLNQLALQQAGIDVETSKLLDAVDDLMKN